ncbi:hypothetical protein N9D02_05175 [Emcibacteraceae bacterium]|jgi:hypothetical protein|nr:hypothetical protein [Emcibacteraceae bacterium]
MKIFLTVITYLLLCTNAFAQTANDVLDRDFRLMMNWLEGEFDNSEQFFFEEEMKVPTDERKTRIHMTFKKNRSTNNWRECFLPRTIYRK